MTSSWHEGRIDRQIREAQENGDFENLPGFGKPLPKMGEHYDENWWVKDYMQREDLQFVGPPALALRKEVEDLPQALAKKITEQQVRAHVEELNSRIRELHRTPQTGPFIYVKLVDVDEAVRGWRESRTA